MRNVVYCFTVFVMDVATFWAALFENTAQKKIKHSENIFQAKLEIGQKSGFL